MSDTLSRAFDAVGFLSPKIERGLRRRTKIYPKIAVVSRTPLGRNLSKSFYMNTQGGNDQVTRSIHGWRWDYELPQMALYEAALHCWRPGPVIDVGANSGVYSLLSEAICGRNVIALEPLPDVADLCENNLILNDSCLVTLQRIAASDKAGEAEIFLPSKKVPFIETSASLDASVHEKSGGGLGQSFIIRMDTLDHIVGVRTPAIIKIDVEGHETPVLKHSIETLVKCRPLVFCEILTHMHSDAEICELLKSIDYEKAAILPTSIKTHSEPDPSKRQWDWLLFHRCDRDQVAQVCQIAQISCF